jgi:hypothetical protein
LVEVALAARSANESAGPLLVFDDANGRVVDLDLRGSDADVVSRLLAKAGEAEPEVPEATTLSAAETPQEPRGRGRPRLGVVAREVTLLPRHWDWLADERGGASVALRRLVEEARRNSGEKRRMLAAQEASYRFMSAMAGNLPGFEEAARALFAHDRARFAQHVAGWPRDVRAYAERLAFGSQEHIGQPTRAEMSATPKGARSAHLEPRREAVIAFMRDAPTGELVMLNLLLFRDVADYSANPELAPERPISGAEAYDRYIAHTMPYLRASGGEVLFSFEAGSFLIGPEDERWDRALLVRQTGIEAYLAFAGNAAYLAGLGHRTAALADSRLLPLTELPLPV